MNFGGDFKEEMIDLIIVLVERSWIFSFFFPVQSLSGVSVFDIGDLGFASVITCELLGRWNFITQLPEKSEKILTTKRKSSKK